jgi:hypothetical protein
MRQYIGAVIAVRNFFTPLCLFRQTSPNNLAVASGNGNRFFTQKLHVQIANKPGLEKTRVFLKKPSPVGFFGFFGVFLGFFGFFGFFWVFWVFLPGREGF